ncbi:hypothetical protein [uncultured Herbaspirillum sp.]|uniref:hypothetical protein n=1 Tax=uncultured Herbaspirillum sp. TaxID=160236 RepID=UPI0026270469|nr:hypothetical protein [uncultured Herbaspirillum sp.]
MNRVAPDGVAGEAVTPVCRERVAAASKRSQVAPLHPKPNGFWQRMFAARHDGRLWNPHLRRVFPHLDAHRSVAQHRKAIHDALETIRQLRNRIAHHEPIFHRALEAEYRLIGQLIAWRSPQTFRRMHQHQQITTWLAARP